MKRTYQPKKRQRQKVHGFRKREQKVEKYYVHKRGDVKCPFLR